MQPSPSNKAWLDLTVEETLEPELPICDPHHHLWEFRHERVAHRYLLNELLEDAERRPQRRLHRVHRVRRHVQAHGPGAPARRRRDRVR